MHGPGLRDIELRSTTKASVAEQGATVASSQAPAKTGAIQKKGAAKGGKRATRSHTQSGRSTRTAKGGKETKPVTKRARQSKGEGKGATIVTLIGRPKGASLKELMQATGWQAHSVRGFLSTISKKQKLKVASEKNEAGERVYTVKE
jgi:hypothetical protein